ncbi:MAG: TIM barrel protein [Phycisphaera sp.]|nr:TIM barrel protein [Phycisphaera sp.]
MTTLSRRSFLSTTAGVAAASAAGLVTPLPAHAMKPLVRTGKAVRKLSLAAYSMRKYLPNTKSKPDATGEMDMLGFLDYCSDLGLGAAELTSYFFPNPLDAAYINKIKQHAHVQGIDLSGGAIGNNFAYAPDSDTLKQQMQYTHMWIDHYAAMGVPVIRVFAGHPAKGEDENQAVENIIVNLRAACEYAATRGVILAMENHDFTTDIPRFMKIVEAVDSPWFGVNLDSGNLRETADPYADLARMAPYALNAQIKVEIPVNGKKQPTDFARVVNILKDAGYSGYVVLEYEANEEPRDAIPRYLDILAKLI